MKKRVRPLSQRINIFDEPYVTHKQAIELSKQHIDTKPIKKDLK